MTGATDPSKVSGQAHSVKGAVTETIGNVTGHEGLQSSGKKEHAEGEAEYKGAQAKGYVEATTDRIVGLKDSLVGSVTGDKGQEAAGNVQKEKGKAGQEINS